MNLQSTSKIFMVRPSNFGFNPDTAQSNAFQSTKVISNSKELAIQEFDSMVTLLRSKTIDVQVFQDTIKPIKPDAIFPNNWITTHYNGTIITYPMEAPNRQLEITEDIIKNIHGYSPSFKKVSLEGYIEKNMFLEGTGSMILDRPNKVVYACHSTRTHPEILSQFCETLGFSSVLFDSLDSNQKPIYHTNVMMALGTKFCIICLESIPDRKSVV